MEVYERNVRHLMAFDNLNTPLSSLYQKAKKRHKDIAVDLEGAVLDDEDFGCAVIRIEKKDKKKARAMTDAIAEFSEKHPKYGRELQGMIAQKRVSRERHLFYGLEEGRRISSQDYIGAMIDCGLSENQSRELYPVLLDLSRGLQQKKLAKDGLRRVLIGSSFL